MSDKAITGSYVDKRLPSGSGWECELKIRHYNTCLKELQCILNELTCLP